MNKEYVNWIKFKSNTKGKMLEKVKEGYIEFCELLHKADFELISNYAGDKGNVELRYKFDSRVKLNICPSNFKNKTYKTIVNFKNKLIENGDKFIKFVGLTSKGKLISQIKTFDGGFINLDISRYNSFNNGRQDFYKKLKEVNGYTEDSYIGTDVKINIQIDGVNLKPISPDNFKRKIYNYISNFKKELIKNGDMFVKLVGLTNNGRLIAKIKTYDNGMVNMDTSRYKLFAKGRQDFYNKLRKINAYTTDSYVGKDIKMNIYIDGVDLEMSVDNFKYQTYKRIINFKNNIINNGDRFIKFIDLTDNGSLVANIRTYDGENIFISINSYSYWSSSRKDTYDYCKEKCYKILSPYISTKDKILIDFDCGHKPNWISPNALKNNIGCPVCSESKGEKVIRLYLEKNNIDFIQEYKFDDCKHKRSLPFDFYIPSLNLCIEFDGIQHFEVFDHFGGENVFKNTQKRDKIKTDYCKNNNIRLIRIPYWELDEIEEILDKSIKI